jgi:preprotein translocase subunit SecG
LNFIGKRSDKMRKMTALLLAIFFVLSVLGCATTQDTAKLDEQIDTMKKREEAQMWQRATGP